MIPPHNGRTALQNVSSVEQTSGSSIGLENRRHAVSLFMTLVVEDDSLQREVLADILKREGLEVIECTTAEAAELVLATTGLELRALVTDVHLDGEMSGIELAEYAKRKYPDLNVIVMSGRDTPTLPRDTRFLQKPFRPAELLQAINSG
jgi:DNA-binding NtrC family response regulator